VKKYDGKTGRIKWLPEPEQIVRRPHQSFDGEVWKNDGKASGHTGLAGGLDNGIAGLAGLGRFFGANSKNGIFPKIGRFNLEMEDLILVAVFYLVYRESGDIEFLLIAGAMLLL
jgi:hypothetical protein